MTAPLDLDKFKTKPAGHVIRGGKRIELNTLEPKSPARKRRKQFKPQFALVSVYWIKELEKYKSAGLYQLAHCILLEDHKCKQIGGEIILSRAVTGLPRQTRAWAIRKMVEAKMIEVSQTGNEAVRVVKLLHTHSKKTGNEL